MYVLKLAISGENLSYTDDLDFICSVLKANDIRFIELWPLNVKPIAGRDVHPRLYSGRDLEEAKGILDKHGISVCCVSFCGSFAEDLVADPKRYSKELAYTVEVAHFFGAKLVNTYCHLISSANQVDGALLESFYLEAVKRAQELDVTIVLENEAHDMVRTPERMRAAVEQFATPHFRTNFDATNYYQASFEAFPLAYDLLKNQIAYVHIKNGRLYQKEFCPNDKWLGGALSGCYAPGNIYYTLVEDGCVNIHDLLLRLQKDGYDGYCTLEPHSVREEILKYYEPELAYLRTIPVFE